MIDKRVSELVCTYIHNLNCVGIVDDVTKNAKVTIELFNDIIKKNRQ